MQVAGNAQVDGAFQENDVAAATGCRAKRLDGAVNQRQQSIGLWHAATPFHGVPGRLK